MNLFNGRRLLKKYSLILSIFLAALIGAAPGAGFAQSQTSSDNAVAAASTPESLSPKDRLEVFEEVWETIEEKYHDPAFNGVNWKAVSDRYLPMVSLAKSDEDFYTVLKKMVGELHDAHTRFHTPRERREREQATAVSTGVSIYEVEGRAVVVGVEPDSQAARAGVEAGMIVRTIDGKPVSERLREAQSRVGSSSSDRAIMLRLYRQLTDGEPGSSVKLGLERADGGLFDVEVTRRVVADNPKVTSSQLQSGYGYIKLSLWKSPVHKEFRRALEGLRNAPGLIIDLRGNPGGEAGEVVKIASYFFNNRVSFGRFISRSGRAINLFTDRDDLIYQGPVVVLVNESSGSGSELFTGVMQENGRALVIGRQSCGCVLGISRFKKVKGGGELAVSELKYVSPQGHKLEGTGVIPDRMVALTISDLQRRRDAALIEAEHTLRSPKASAK
ncbi:MAG TPA: S41 family peptidase [Blastocatellia bacterium]|nr:S41 family peptidase [Blastocatellia bacterium]